MAKDKPQPQDGPELAEYINHSGAEGIRRRRPRVLRP